MNYYAGIEAGGTKFICTIANEQSEIIERISLPTETPMITLPKVIDFFHKYKGKLLSIGIGSFGPVDLNKNSKTYGYITDTPKSAWKNFNFVGSIQAHFDLPIGFDTDVNAAALGENKWGAAIGINNFIYITVGTGVGVGGIINSQLIHGLTHPEMGHVIVRRSIAEKEDFRGTCIYHNDCLEGLASGTAINARWNTHHCSQLQPDHAAWPLQAEYLAQALMNYILICSPEKIIIGGGVMKQKQLFPMIQEKLQKLLNGYISHPSIQSQEIESYIIPPKLGDNAGCLGAIALAQNAYM
jgi:fructokinase